MSSSSEPSYSDRIKAYYATCPDTTQFIGESYTPPHKSTTLEKGVEDLKLSEQDQFKRDFDRAWNSTGSIEIYKKKEEPKETTKQDASITDKVAKESSDSTASSHKLHDEDNQATSGGSVSAMAHKANPGPVIADNLPAPSSKEELKKRAQELNE